MAIAASGAVSLSDFRSEFVGGSAAISLGDLYRGGSNIRAKAGNNTATNLAANIPASGAIDFADFYSQAKGFRKTYSSGATNQDASAVFGDDYAVNYPKEIVINSGVELGATSTSQEALQIDSGLSGGLTITNNGTLSGAGGAANGGAGGDAFQADVACTLINNGTIRSGGGGGGAAGAGGAGGTGGQGQTSSTGVGAWSGYTLSTTAGNQYMVQWYSPGQYRNSDWYWAGSNVGSYYVQNYNYQPTTHSSGGYTYQRSAGGSASGFDQKFQIRRRQNSVTTYTYYNGGAGGAGGGGGNGGVGQGYGQSAGSGSSGSGGSGGSGGGTNAGSGGTGGTGGTGGAGASFGNSGSSGATGSTGNTGGNGNHTNGSGGSGGSGGSSGGAAGKYIRGLSNVSFTNNGTVQGGTA